MTNLKSIIIGFLSASCIFLFMGMTDKEILDFCKLTGIRTKDNSIEFVKAQVIKLANDDPNRFSKLSLDAIARAIPPIPSPVINPVAFTLNTSPKIIKIKNIFIHI